MKSSPPVTILKPHYVILPKVITRLDFDDLEVLFTWILQSMLHSQRDVSGLIDLSGFLEPISSRNAGSGC